MVDPDPSRPPDTESFSSIATTCTASTTHRPSNRYLCRKNALKKQPQRGLGVAQLEKLRLEEETKQEADCLASLHRLQHLHCQGSSSVYSPPQIKAYMPNPSSAFNNCSAVPRSFTSSTPSMRGRNACMSSNGAGQLSSFQMFCSGSNPPWVSGNQAAYNRKRPWTVTQGLPRDVFNVLDLNACSDDAKTELRGQNGLLDHADNGLSCWASFLRAHPSFNVEQQELYRLDEVCGCMRSQRMCTSWAVAAARSDDMRVGTSFLSLGSGTADDGNAERADIAHAEIQRPYDGFLTLSPSWLLTQNYGTAASSSRSEAVDVQATYCQSEGTGFYGVPNLPVGWHVIMTSEADVQGGCFGPADSENKRRGSESCNDAHDCVDDHVHSDTSDEIMLDLELRLSLGICTVATAASMDSVD